VQNEIFTLSYFIVDLLIRILLCFQIGPQTFFICNCIIFLANSRAIESNLLTNDKIEKQETKPEQTP